MCTGCKEELPESSFYKRGDTNRLRSECKSCIANKAKVRNSKPETKELNRARSRKYILKQYGLTEDEFLGMLGEQGNVCKICHVDLLSTGSMDDLVKVACVDHCHHTGVVRGILCRRCNSGLGYFRDEVALVEKAVEYLRGTG